MLVENDFVDDPTASKEDPARSLQDSSTGEECSLPEQSDEQDAQDSPATRTTFPPLPAHSRDAGGDTRQDETNARFYSHPLDRLHDYNHRTIPFAPSQPGGITIIVNGIPLHVGDVGPAGSLLFFLFPFLVFGFFVWMQRRVAASLPQYPGGNRSANSTGGAAAPPPPPHRGGFHMPAPDRGPPPAKPYLLEELPLLTLVDQDKDLTLRPFCAVCVCDFEVGEQVRRLPCAHVYHDECLASWLLRRCTCPTCRWELPTDDLDYEAGRLQRMAQRRPQFFKYELDHRLSIRQIKTLLTISAHHRGKSSGDSSYRPVDRDDFIAHLIENQLIEVIPDTEDDQRQPEQEAQQST